MDHENKSFGVFKPVGHIVISFPTREAATAATAALAAAGLGLDDLYPYTDQEMLQHADSDLAHSSPIASLGQELNLVRAHRVLAQQGYHFLVVRVPDDLSAQAIAEIARAHGALRAQLYGHFIIEELIQNPDALSQVAESPDRGLDAQTSTGLESQAAEQHREKWVDPMAVPPEPKGPSEPAKTVR
jgi:hypothetical protein